MDRIGKFEVVEKIGEGGFGVIYKGLDPHIQRHVAIKTCTSSDPEIRRRFVHEARIAGNLHHRHIVTVYDFGLQGEEPYLVQEYLSGEDLDRKIKRREHLPVATKLEILSQVARGLQHAHERGVVHRDIKPANLRILADGSVKIMDFGIAKLAHQDTGLTRTGMTLGTASYLAPEQIRGAASDHRADIFSFGVLAYELLAGERPFQGQHISTVLYKILHAAPPSLDRAWPGCPPLLERLVQRCLAKEPEERYQSFAEVLADLEQVEAPGGDELAPTHQLDMQGVLAAAAATPELVELELAAPPDERTPHEVGAATAMRRRGAFDWGRWAAAVVLLAVVAVAGWSWWRVRLTEGTPAATTDGIVADEEGREGGIPTLEAPSSPPAANTASEATGATASPPSQPEGISPEADGEETAVRPGEPEPPSPPAPGTAVLTAGWSAAVTVRVDDRTLRLDRQQTLELPPGRHHLRYSVVDGDYRASKEVVIELAPGQRRRVEVPFDLPGELQVQPDLGASHGTVQVGGASWGEGRIPARRVAPGRHRLEVSPLEGGPPTIQRVVEVPSGRRVVASYDLATGSVRVRDTALDG